MTERINRTPRPASVPIHTWVIAYDVSDTGRRSRIAELLGGYGERVQFSVFECRVNEHEIEDLRQKVMTVADKENDRIRWYPLCHPCFDRVTAEGKNSISEGDDGYYIV